MTEKISPGRQSTIGKMAEKTEEYWQSVLGRLKGRKAEPDNSQRTEGIIMNLNRIYDTAEDLTSVFLDPSEYSSLSIKCEELKLKDNGSYALLPQPCFFKPLSLRNILSHPVNRHAMCERDRNYQDIFDKAIESFGPLKSTPIEAADLLCSRLSWEVAGYPRVGTDCGNSTLFSLAKWATRNFTANGVFSDVFEDTLFNSNEPPWNPVEAYKLPEEYPHTMFTMRHDVQGEEELLRGEVLAIVAAMSTRMKLYSPSGHLYIPVLVFSFMGKQHGRILQAYYNGTAVVIRMTKLYDFTTAANARKHLQLFAQHMANNPTGNTKDWVTYE
ncbi:hypothetical protein MW887_002166 [Aspergillus wentii]|nr:hypothetical protein MW887_002166 [Aspergillus wentii]